MLTAEQNQLRKNHLGASEGAAVLGLDPFQTTRTTAGPTSLPALAVGINYKCRKQEHDHAT